MEINGTDRATSGEIGELLEKPGEVRGLWRIPNFPSLLKRDGKQYFSPKFLFLDAVWRWKFTFKDNEWIGLFLRIKKFDSPKEVRYSFSIRHVSGENGKRVLNCATFSQKDPSWGAAEFLKVTDLQKRRTHLTPSDVLTISYTLKSDAQSPSEGFLFRRLWNTSRSFRNILCRQKRTDVTLKLRDGKLSAHRMILESRSPVFKRMFKVDMRECQTGEVTIEDATIGAFQVVLYYAYSGDPDGLSCENMYEVFKMAHRYEFEDLRKFCIKLMRETLCVDTVCDVMSVADLYQETALKVCVRDYFARNKTDVFKSEKWKTFKKDNPSNVCEMLEWVIDEEI